MDDKYHIYERGFAVDEKYNQNLAFSGGQAGELHTGICIARIYSCGPGYDICPMGSGYMVDEKDIKYLEENYGFKIKANGYTSEAQSLLDLGITQINLATTDETTLYDNFNGRGNQLTTQEGATFIQNGEEKEYADIWHKKIKD